MSEQSGPITREQVERAIDAAYDCNAQGVNAALGAFWYEREDIPADVRDGWRQVGYLGLRIALTRWHAELAAAEPVRRVARWDAYALAYAAKNADGAVHYYQHADRAKADGYEIEGGPEPEPASPPAPEVVDVPQPLVKRFGGVEAQWDLGEDHVTLVEPARGVGLPAPLALLRAMLAAIDAQQGGAS